MKAMRICLLLPAAASLMAQAPVAPTSEPVGEARGQNLGNYNLLQSWEVGYRFHDVTGNEGKYRSDVNYGNGVRLLSSRLSLNSRDGRGGWFDELLLTTQGLGNDPYEFANVRLAKNRLYRYDAFWRSNEYYNPALAISGGWHAMDTVRRIQDHDVTLLPQSKIRFFFGFTRAVQEGPALTSGQFFDFSGDEYPLFANVHRRQNEFRFGNEFQILGMRWNWMQNWESYSEDTPVYLNSPSAGANPNDRSRLDNLSRQEPWTGTTPSFRLNIFRDKAAKWAVSGRFNYSAGRRDFTFAETASGLDRFGPAQNRQILTAGNARRPLTAANLTVSLFPASKLTLTNHTAFHSTRMEGDSRYQEFNNASLDYATVDFRYLGVRNFTNSTDALYQFKPWIAARGGFQYSNREIRSIEQTTVEGFTGTIRSSETNQLEAGTAGVRLIPARSFSLALDGELGRQNRPFYPVSNKDYHSLSARARYRKGPVTLTALARSFYNFNFASLFAHSARTRQYGVDGSWAPRDWFSIEGGYSKLHADTATGVAYFLAATLIQGRQSIYISNLHAGHLGARLALKERVDLYFGLSTTRDTGDGRTLLAVPPGGPILPVFGQAQTFPMNFDSPLGRVSIRLHPKVRLNAGYQYYRYREDLLPAQNYHANTGYVSVLWTF